LAGSAAYPLDQRGECGTLGLELRPIDSTQQLGEVGTPRGMGST